MSFYAYILASRRNGTLYTGSTDNLARRIYEHQEKIRAGFASKYDVTLLVWFEQFETRLRREQQVREALRGERAELALGVLDGEGHEAESRVRREFDARRDEHGRDTRAARRERAGRENSPHRHGYRAVRATRHTRAA